MLLTSRSRNRFLWKREKKVAGAAEEGTDLGRGVESIRLQQKVYFLKSRTFWTESLRERGKKKKPYQRKSIILNLRQGSCWRLRSRHC